MNKTKNVLQIVVDFSSASTVKDLKRLIHEQVGDIDIVRYSINGNKAILYIEVIPSDKIHTIQIEVPEKTFSTINVVESILENAEIEYEGSIQQAFSQPENHVPSDATVIIFDADPLIDELLEKEFKLSKISNYDGLISITTEDGLIILEKSAHVTIDYGSYKNSAGTVKLIQTERSSYNPLTGHPCDVNHSYHEEYVKLCNQNSEFEEISQIKFHELVKELDDIVNDISLTEQFKDSVFGPGIAKAEEHARMSTERNTINLMADIMSTFHAIENDEPYNKPDNTVHYDKNVQAMKELLENMQDLGEEISMGKAVAHTEVSIDSPTINAQELGVDEDGDEGVELYAAYGIGDTVVETVTLKVALISFNSFDEYAKNHNIVGWDLFTPTTLLIKYTEEGVTSDEKIAKFHDMMNSLDTGWIEKTSSEAKFLSEYNQILDRDLVAEFLARVKKHNIFVRENIAKMRSALLDMEKDFEGLKNDVNLTIDWESLTAQASKKERTEIRTKGVEIGYGIEDGKRTVNGKLENVVKVNTGLIDGDFFIPVTLVTDEVREKYVLDNYVYYIDDVPEYAFYEVAVNGHVMIIEKTDL